MAQENTAIQKIPMIFDAMTYIVSLHTTYIVLFRYYLRCVVSLLLTLCCFVITYIVLFRYYLHFGLLLLLSLSCFVFTYKVLLLCCINN